MTDIHRHDLYPNITYEDGAYYDARIGPGSRPMKYGLATSIKGIRNDMAKRSPIPFEKAQNACHLETVREQKLYHAAFVADQKVSQKTVRGWAIFNGIVHGWLWQQKMFENRRSYASMRWTPVFCIPTVTFWLWTLEYMRKVANRREEIADMVFLLEKALKSSKRDAFNHCMENIDLEYARQLRETMRGEQRRGGMWAALGPESY